MRIKRSSAVTMAFAVALAGSACAARQGQTSSSRNVVTREELVETNARNLYRALEQIRPSWLSSRGPAGMSNVRDAGEAIANVYINGNHMGTIEFLREYYVADVHEVRYWDAGQAGARFGMGNPRGVIEIIPRR